MSTVTPSGRAGATGAPPVQPSRPERRRAMRVSEALAALRTPGRAERSARRPLETARTMLDRLRRG